MNGAIGRHPVSNHGPSGGSLADALERGPVGLDRALMIVAHVAEALAAAHRQGIVHRDVKPANVLLDEDGDAYLPDFSVAGELGAPTHSAPGASPSDHRSRPAASRQQPAPTSTAWVSSSATRWRVATCRLPSPE